ncbi:hypothetical protein LUZ60_012328 [Juncus effusus]|nr:hypothetical protein LUZ60_012328 [Juncus effusus]
MLEETIPTLWSVVHSWFTPTVFFILLNLVIGTIAVTSKSNHHQHSSAAGDNHQRQGGGAPLARAPSLVLGRLRSFNFSQFVSGDQGHHGEAVQSAEEPVPAGRDHRGGGGLTRAPSIVLDRLRSFDFSRFISGEVQVRTETVDPEPVGEPILSHLDDEQEHHIERTCSDAMPPKGKLVKHMKKSASDKSAFDHFKAEEIPRPSPELAAPAEEEDGEVDAKADDFINKFKNQLRLQRMDSIMRYKEMLTRGAGEVN